MRIAWIAAAVAVSAPVLPAMGSSAAGGTLTVLVTGLKSDQGTVRIALSDSESCYSAKQEKHDRKMELPIHDNAAKAVFEGLPPGEYAVKLFHDRNGNGKFDTILGVPVEDYAFSNNARGFMGPPPFDKVKFTFSGRPSTIEIRIGEGKNHSAATSESGK